MCTLAGNSSVKNDEFLRLIDRYEQTNTDRYEQIEIINIFQMFISIYLSI